MKITYDKEADAIYIYLKKAKVKETIEIGEDFIIDIDNKKNVIGFEILNASKNIKKDKNKPVITIGKKTLPLSISTFK